MFGQVGQIIEGHVNEVLKLEQELYNKRKPICDKCKLKTYKEIAGLRTQICNPDLYLNLETDNLSKYPKEGYHKGCGCRVEASTRVKDKKCPVGKW